MSWQDVQRDDPTQPVTIPENPTAGRRYMRRDTASTTEWDVYDWQEEVNEAGSQWHCYILADDLTEKDARFLVFGQDLLDACKEAYRDCEEDTWENSPLGLLLAQAIKQIEE